MKRLVVLGVAALILVGVVQAIRMLPWWALVLGLVVLVVGGKYIARRVVGRVVRKVFLMPFQAKGAVLKGASAVIHRISPVPASEVDVAASAESTAAGESRDHYLVEVTITPEAADGPFALWEPGELRLVKPESVLHPESDEPDDEDNTCEIKKVQIEGEGQWADDEGMKYGGPQKLRLSLAVLPGTRTLKFRYYFEEFGTLRLMLAAALSRKAAAG